MSPMRKKTIKVRYTGPVPIRIPGIAGHINRDDEIEVPVEMAKNLDRDFFFEIKKSKPRIPKKQEKEKKEVKDE